MKMKLLICALALASITALSACSEPTNTTKVEADTTDANQLVALSYNDGFVEGYEMAREDFTVLKVEEEDEYFTLNLNYRQGEPVTVFSYSIAPYKDREACENAVEEKIENIISDGGFDITHSCTLWQS